jgi:hypothetical protein
MSEPLFNVRMARKDQKLMAKAAEDLHTDRSSLARFAIKRLIGELQTAGLITKEQAPTPLH